MPDVSDVPSWLTLDDLVEPVHRLLGNRAVVESWNANRLTGGSSDALGIWRASGTARTTSGSMTWSLILKGWRLPSADESPSSMSWPLREAQLYRSGLLDNLPGGIAAPACYGFEERDDGSTWLWTEDVQESAPGTWPLERFASHARLLGQLNGAWVTGRPLPRMPGLSRGWIRERVEAAAPFIEMLPQAGDWPWVRLVYPPAVANVYLRIWADRDRWYAALDRLPRTFCHMDAFPRNAFTRVSPDGREQSVLIDWSFAGIAALAEGLRDAGWHGDPREVRRGYAIAAVLRYGLGAVGRYMPVLLDERTHPLVEQVFGFPAEEAFATGAAVQRWLVDLLPAP